MFEDNFASATTIAIDSPSPLSRIERWQFQRVDRVSSPAIQAHSADSMFDNPDSRPHQSEPARSVITYGRAALVLLGVLAWLGLLCHAFPPQWETNDDVAMSMLAHGYGIAEAGSPGIVFSNVLWGMFARSWPSFALAQGYSLAMYASLAASITAILYVVSRQAGRWIGMATAMLVSAPAAMFPQFTITAGLSALASVLCVFAWQQRPGWKPALAATLLAFVAYIIRAQQAILVLLVALPLLHPIALMKKRQMQLAAIAFCCAAGVASLIDRSHYSGKEWERFQQIDRATMPYRDYGLANRLLERPDVYTKAGYSRNDVILLGNWGHYAFPEIAEPAKLDRMADELGEFDSRANVGSNLRIGWNALFDRRLLPLLVLGLGFALLMANYQAVGAWAIFLMAISTMSALGRPGIMRVYLPVMLLLVILPLVMADLRGSRKWIFGISITAAALTNMWFHIGIHRETAHADDRARMTKLLLDRGEVVAWGAGLPFESLFPVFGSRPDLRLFSLGAFAPAPTVRSRIEHSAGNGIAARMMVGQPIPVAAAVGTVDGWSAYCREHLSRQPEVEMVGQFSAHLVLSIFRCNAR
jgi:hypothetical protein